MDDDLDYLLVLGLVEPEILKKQEFVSKLASKTFGFVTLVRVKNKYIVTCNPENGKKSRHVFADLTAAKTKFNEFSDFLKEQLNRFESKQNNRINKQ
jgi:hypothetical protein